MKKNMRRWPAALFCLALCTSLSACGHKREAAPETKTETGADQKELKIDTEQGTEPVESSAKDGPTEDERMIKEQTFEATLKPLGKVTFASYRPDTALNPLADAEFKLLENGQVKAELEGMFERNIRANDSFHKVEAVSFPDYNSDGYNDIIIICDYSPESGPETDGYSEARIYSGSETGTFTLERKLTEDANSAVAEKTVPAILGFLGAGRADTQESLSEWKDAYMKHLQAQDESRWQGYQLIYVNDDEIPELVEIGNSEAAGCGIVTYADGAADETILQRLNFTYIERGNLLCNSDGNMDSYYDLVYRMTDGRLTQIAAGYYGAADNSRVEVDAEGNPIYQYQWNGEFVSPEDYGRALNEIYDTSKAKQGYDWGSWLSREEAIQAVNELS